MLANSLIRSAFALTAALCLAVGCSEGSKAAGENNGSYTPPGSSSGTATSDGGGSSSGYDPIVREGGAADTRNYFQTKSAAQLSASVAQCVGAGKTLIAEDMLAQPTTGPAVTCSVAANANACFFLPRGLYAQGTDVIAAQTTLFDGAESATRQGTRPDQLGVEVLTALQAVGNVVGSACSRAPADVDCGCASVDAARAMVARCLPSFDPTTAEYEAAVSALQTTCASNPAGAIASMIASYAFLRVN